MPAVASAGPAERIVARILFKVLRAGSGTVARYSSTSFGATLAFAVEWLLPDFAFFIMGRLPAQPSLAVPRSLVCNSVRPLITLERLCEPAHRQNFRRR